MKNFDKYLQFASNLIGADGRFKNQAELARFADIMPSQAKKYCTPENLTNIKKFMEYLDKLGVRLSFDTENLGLSKDVCFVDAQIVPAGEGMRPPEVEDYLAVPLVGEAGAGPGIIPQDELLSWFLVYKNVHSVMHRRNLIAVQIAPRSTSMEPLLHPGDIVLVDRDDKDVSRPGRIMLVMEPDDGAGKIKRVAVEPIRGEGKDCRITFYSDNAAQNPPEVLRLNEDYGGDMSKAIVGRVVWAWSDVSNK